MNNSDFCHLHVHMEYSLLDGFGSAENYAAHAKEMGFEYLACTDHGNVDGLIKFQQACKKNEVKPLFGVEMYMVGDISKKEKKETRYHVTLLAKNNEGWKNILKMLTVANLEGYHWRPRIDWPLLKEHLEGLVVLTGCASSFLTIENSKQILLGMKRRIPDDVYLEVMPHVYEPQNKINKICLEAAERFSLPLVATNDCHYITDEDTKAQEVLLAIQSKKKWKDPQRWKFDITGLYMRSADEMASLFRKQGVLRYQQYRDAIYNTMEIADKCSSFSIDNIAVDLPHIKRFKGRDDVEVMKEICDESYAKLIKEKGLDSKRYRDQYKEEFGIITGQGFARYFLIVWELVDWCKKNDIMVGPGRGSSGGSLIAFLMGITSVDPLKFGLNFYRFISPARIDLPDIDMDFEDIKRPLIRKHLEEEYGHYNVAGCATFMAMKGRGAVRDVSRVFDLPLADVNKASKSIVVRSGGDFRSDFTIEDAFQTFEDGKKFMEKYPEAARIAMKIEGQARGLGQHAAAIIISSDDLREGGHANLRHGKEKELVVNWDKLDLEHVGLMKLDVLGLNALTVLNETRRLIKKNHGKDIVFEEIPLDDKRVYSEFSKGHCIGCFQFGSLGLRRLCQELVIDDFMMLTHCNALHRPGTLRSGMTTEFIRRKKGEVEWEHIHPVMEKLTGETFGIILYQEQVMQFMYELGGLPWKTADTVRKVISKSQGVDQFMKFKEQFVKGCIERKTLDRESAEKVWDQLASFGSYGFNKSHSVEYTLIAVWDQWLKIYYPSEFLSISLTYGSDEKKEDLIEESHRIGIEVRPPKFGISEANRWVVKGGIMYCPFIEIKGVGDKAAEALAAAPKVKNKEGFVKKDGRKINSKIEELLIDIKAYDDIKITDEEADRIENYFAFSFSRDPMRKYRKLFARLKESVEFSIVKGKDWGKVDKEQRYYFGQMTQIRFGYRSVVSKLSTEDRMKASGGADYLGGVYGNFKDQTDFCMLVFATDIYNRKKDEIEHCEGDFLVAKANIPSRTTSLHCSDCWFTEDLFSANIDGMGLSLANKVRYRDPALKACDACSLRKECREPVMPSIGVYNIMIAGEAPGWEEDKEGKGFVGKSGDVLWGEMEKYGLRRINFHITNIVKCFPRSTKTPDRTHIKSCSRWIDAEIKELSPPLILAMGNTGMKYFLDEESGIMAKNGTTEWSDKFGAWICWCIHPASVLYRPENKEMFEEAIKNFADKIRIIGGINNGRKER